MTMSFTGQEKLARLRLIRTDNVGPVTFHKLISRYGSAERALDALPGLSERGGRHQALTPFSVAAAEEEMDRVHSYGATPLFHGEHNYPALLAEIDDAPPVLTVLGVTKLLSQKALGIVGARNASLPGRKIAEQFAAKAGQAGYTTVSGLARGIDSAVHTASITTGTIAAVAGGIDVIYPPEHDTLYRQIAENGAIVAESPFGVQPIARHFPRRNRIISGLCLGVVIVEAALKSGSLITARTALEQNRELFAVPGSPLDPRAGGTNKLLQDGAHIATSADDILQVLHSLRLRPFAEKTPPDWLPNFEDIAEPEIDVNLKENILEKLNYTPIHVDELIRSLETPAAYVISALMELEIAGRIERQAGNKVNLC